jgi:flagella basal body P-ring formation protein FlgA
MAMGRSIFKIGLFFAAALFLGTQPGEGASRLGVTMNFKTQVLVDQENIYLGDVATIQGSPQVWVDQIRQLKLKPSPAPGEVLILSGEEIASRIHRNKLSSYVSQLEIPGRIAVVREGRILEKQEVMQLLQDHLARVYDRGNRTARVREIQGYDQVIIPPGQLACEVKVFGDIYKGGSIPVSMILRVDKQEVKELRFRAQVEIEADVVIARNYLPRHKIIEEKDIQLVRKNITHLPHDVMRSLAEVLGKRTTLSLNGQEMVRRSMIEFPPLVRKGDRVVLLIDNDHFRITSLGEAKEDGRRGDRVKLINISSKKEVSGLVLDAQTIRVDY